MPRALLVAYFFPPLGGIGSLRALGYARYLSESGWATQVLAPRGGAYHRDEQLLFPEDRVVRSASFELSRVAKKVLRAGGDDVKAAQVGGVRSALRTSARAALYFPDAQVGWAPFALHAGRRALRDRPVDVIVSSSFPITAHVVARRLAREVAVPWVAEFRDPWSEMQPPGPRRQLSLRLERSLARDAAAIVMTSPAWAERHARLWGRPVDVIPNGHDLASPPAATAPAAVVLTYLGTYYPATQASLGAIWAAVRRLDVEPGPRVDEIRIVGELHPAMRAELEAHGLAQRVRITGFLPNVAAIEQLASSSVALLAGPADAGGILAGQVAGKVWEYLATDLPVIYVGAPESDAARLLNEQEGTHVVAGGDAVAAEVALRAVIGRRYPRDTEAFSRRARARALGRVLDRVVA